MLKYLEGYGFLFTLAPIVTRHSLNDNLISSIRCKCFKVMLWETFVLLNIRGGCCIILDFLVKVTS